MSQLPGRLLPPSPSLSPSPFTLADVRGLRAAGVRAGIKASGRPDVALLASDEPFSAAALFTQNRLPAAPVVLSRGHLEKTGGRARALVVNSGNANACTGEQGERDARAMAEQVARGLGCSPEEVLVCSTGVIGVKLPMDRVRAGIDQALASLASGAEAGRAFLDAIQTTDAFPKEAGEAASGGVVAGVCKGAGMIEPNMATMLAFVATDLGATPAQLGEMVRRVARKSFNAVHVDTHASTNDTFVLLSTGKAQASADLAALEAAAGRVSRRLAWLIARDGEGASKVTTIEVRGASGDEAARAIARRVASSALVRTALYGNDPNWGRFVSQVANGPEVVALERLRCTLQGIVVFDRGEPAAFDRAQASRAMKAEDVTLRFDLEDGPGEADLLTSDLGYRYVEVNAEYTT